MTKHFTYRGLNFEVSEDSREFEILVRKPNPEAPNRPKLVGEALFAKSPEQWMVAGIELNEELRRQKIGTLLYKLAASAACKAGSTIVSGTLRSPFSEGFWRKQQARGAAICAIPNERRVRNYYKRPVDDIIHEARGECLKTYGPENTPARRKCLDEKLEVIRRAPQPEHNDHFQPYWPCHQFELRKCFSPLAGLKGAKKPAKKSQRRRARARNTR